MRFILLPILLASLLTSCMQKGPNPLDPYESVNREVHKFNMAFDATMLKPPAKFYVAVVPLPIRVSINNAFNNVNMIPTVGNDLLQAEWKLAIKDTWRFIANSTIGVAGLFDVAKGFGLPPHSNDLGITFAKWGDRKSPYIVIPFLGPATIRDGMGIMFEYALMTPYPYIPDGAVIYGILALRYIDLRSQLFDTEKMLGEAIDQYSFIRDAWLAHRNYRINGEQEPDAGSLYVEEEKANLGKDYVE